MEFQKYKDWENWATWSIPSRRRLNFVREYPPNSAELTLHRTWWFWDGTPLLYQSLGVVEAVAVWPAVGWRLARSSVCADAASARLATFCPPHWSSIPFPIIVVYPVAKYRHAIEPELLLLSGLSRFRSLG